MKLVQYGRSKFVTEFFKVLYEIESVQTLRNLSQINQISTDKVLIVPPKDKKYSYLKNSINQRDIILVSSVCCEVNSYSSKKYSKYKHSKKMIEQDFLGEFKNIQIVRFGMFINYLSPRCIVHLLIAHCLSLFVSKERSFIYTDISCTKYYRPNVNLSLIKKVKGRGLIKTKSILFKKIIARVYVKHSSSSA